MVAWLTTTRRRTLEECAIKVKVIEIDDTKTLTGLPAPEFWHITTRAEDGLRWQRLKGEAISVIESISEHGGGQWLHVSVAKPSKKKMPTYEDIQTARILFVGEDRECYMVFPPKSRYVNIAPVLHLFCCLTAPDGVLPRFEGIIDENGTVSI